MKIYESDADFIKACGILPDSQQASVAFRLRSELAEYCRVAKEAVHSQALLSEIGIHPADSIDVVDFTLMHQSILRDVKLEEEDIQHLIAARGEDTTVSTWIAECIKILERKSR